MAERPRPRDDDVDRGAAPGAPRWVKVFGIIVLVVVLLFAILLLAGGDHGPGRHAPSGDRRGHTPPVQHS